MRLLLLSLLCFILPAAQAAVVTQIARPVARRIIKFVNPGESVSAGQRVGLIRFGSRVDVYLPAGTVPAVAVGQRAVAGETVIGRPGAFGERLRGVRQ